MGLSPFLASLHCWPYPVWYKLRQSEAIVVQQHRACQISQRASDRSLENPQALSDLSNYHEFYRLLARLKTNYQLGELVKVTNYPELIKRIAEFTITDQTDCRVYCDQSEEDGGLHAVREWCRDRVEESLEDQGMINQQLDQLSTIGRCEYEKTCGLLVQLFDEAAQRYQEAINSGTQGVEITIQECRLSWLVYIIGAVIGGQISFASTDDHDAMNGELACRITNLKYWARSEQITWKTLQLLNDLSVGYSSVRKLVKLDAVQFVLSNHTNEHFLFLGLNANNRSFADMRCRTTFYTALARLLMVDLREDDEDKFEEFMVPLTSAFESVGTMLTNMDTPQKEEEAKRAVVGLARDLRGVAFAFNTKTSYMMFFDWMYPLWVAYYPSYTPILHRAIEIWYHDSAVTTPVLKLMAELAQSRSQRLLFDVSSPNCYLLFREVSCSGRSAK
uniref:Exportin-7/Ran-binding protein 17 TPR repeats domain-containing protein n=1 Tax=Magallana gigas TaxID=29159 RepID=A0A8W8MGZ0_MAGGI